MPRTAVSAGGRNAALYLSIAQTLEAEILSGRRAVGEQLPTQRQLASDLRITQGTVNRAYAELARRGLISGEVGRGSFVLDGARSITDPSRGMKLIDMAANKPATSMHSQALKNSLYRISRRPDLSELLGYQPDAGAWHHREAAGRWLARFGIEASPDRIGLTVGAQQANAAVVLATTNAGDTVMVEEFTYTGMKALALALGRRLAPVEMDDKGLIPEALATVAQRTGAKCLYCMPGLHNPTNAMMSPARRREVTRVARKHDLHVIEDGVYDFLVSGEVAPLIMLMPERTFYLTSFSKSVAPGLRVGMVVTPEAALHVVSSETRSLLWTAPPLMAEVATDWINSGAAEELANAHRSECALRVTIASDVLAGFELRMQPHTAHAWLKLPISWTSADFVAAARQQGVVIAPTEAFSARAGGKGEHVRIGLASPETAQEMKNGLHRIVAATRIASHAYLEFT